MPLLHDPVITLEEIRLTRISLSSLDFVVRIRVGNENLLGITLRELPFTVLCDCGTRDEQVASGNTGRVKIPARDSTVLSIPVSSHNAALIGALAAFFTRGSVRVTIRGTAVLDAVLFDWSIPFAKTLPVTMEQVADSLAGEKNSQ